MSTYPVIDLCATGKNIKRLRKENGMSVTQLQEFFGFEYPNAIYKWQKGMSLPTVDNLLALSVLFRVNMNEILVYDQDFLNHRFMELQFFSVYNQLMNNELYRKRRELLWKKECLLHRLLTKEIF